MNKEHSPSTHRSPAINRPPLWNRANTINVGISGGTVSARLRYEHGGRAEPTSLPRIAQYVASSGGGERENPNRGSRLRWLEWGKQRVETGGRRERIGSKIRNK